MIRNSQNGAKNKTNGAELERIYSELPKIAAKLERIYSELRKIAVELEEIYSELPKIGSELLKKIADTNTEVKSEKEKDRQ